MKCQGTTDEQKWSVDLNKGGEKEELVGIQTTGKFSYGADPEAWEYNLWRFPISLSAQKGVACF